MISKILGRKPLVDSYPNLIEKAVEFIKLNGYSAHARRRNSIDSLGMVFQWMQFDNISLKLSQV